MEKKTIKVKVDLVEQARQLRLQAEELERKVKLARGTERGMRARAVTPVIVKPARGPYWTGNDGTTRDLMETIAKMLMDRPWFYRDIVEQTGAGEHRNKGAITALQREGRRVVDVAPEGTGKALWFIPSDEVLERLKRVKRPHSAKRPAFLTARLSRAEFREKQKLSTSTRKI
jgi:hypothetical protein